MQNASGLSGGRSVGAVSGGINTERAKLAMVRYIHGSADSTDLDVVYVFETMPSFEECQIFCRSDPKENRNIIVVKEGIVNACFKGIPDEMNNALLATYPLHEQEHPLLIDRTLPRDVFLKDITITRKVISPLTETPMRRQVKAVLRADWTKRLAFMKELKLTEIDFDRVGKWTKEDLLKSISFQLGQGIGLHHGVELYTKADIAAYISGVAALSLPADRRTAGITEHL